MTARLSLSGRVALIVIVGFMALWVGIIAVAHIMNEEGGASALPPPQRLAALATLIEQAPRRERATILEAVQTPYFQVEIDPEPLSALEGARSSSLDAETLSAYEAVLTDRGFAAAPQIIRDRFPYLAGLALNSVEFKVGLVTGETLIIGTESPFIAVSSGLPLGFCAALIGVFIALGTLIILHREFRPLSRLAEAVATLDPSREGQALPPIIAASPELRALVAAFSQLQDRIATLIRARLALVGGIQHDLRTFATRLRLRVDKIGDDKERAHAVADIEDMITLLDDALLASRAGARQLDEELVELGPLVALEVSDRIAAGACLHFEAELGAAETTVLGDRLALRRIIDNLLDNALNYGGEALLSLSVEGQDLVLTVDDNGPGIPVDKREILLEPFTRLEGSRARRTGGAGLGLAVARNLVVSHDGQLTISDAPLGGARLIVRLPRFLR